MWRGEEWRARRQIGWRGEDCGGVDIRARRFTSRPHHNPSLPLLHLTSLLHTSPQPQMTATLQQLQYLTEPLYSHSNPYTSHGYFISLQICLLTEAMLLHATSQQLLSQRTSQQTYHLTAASNTISLKSYCRTTVMTTATPSCTTFVAD